VEALLAVDQDDLSVVRPGQTVDIQAEQYPGRVFRGKIRQIAALDMDIAHANETVRSGGELETQTDTLGRDRLTSTRYEASVDFDVPENSLCFECRATAKIHTGYRSIGSRLVTALYRVFNFQL